MNLNYASYVKSKSQNAPASSSATPNRRCTLRLTVYTELRKRLKGSRAIMCAVVIATLAMIGSEKIAQAAPTVQRTIELNDTVLSYREHGEGPPVIFVHALLLDSRLWVDQLNEICAQRRCLAPDLSGHGGSSPLLATQVDQAKYAAELLEFMDRVGATQPAHVVGLSAGGVIATLLCRDHPQRCRSLTLISTTLDGALDAAGARYRAENARTVVLEGKDTLFRRFNEYIVSPSATLHARARYRSMLEQTPYETLVAFLTTRSFPNLLEDNRSLSLPVMIPVGTGDSVVNQERAKNFSAIFDNSRIVTLESAGRLLPLEAPKELNSALEVFWKSVEDPEP